MIPYRQDKPLLQLQQDFVDLRFGMFIHYNMATFQDREWGDPGQPASMFDPRALDTDQWATAAQSAGMTWGCLTTKHHDGFCLWPTETRSAHSKLDVVRAFADSFRAAGLRVALYFSILDLREEIGHFNVTPDKIQLIKDQLAELLMNYGDIDLLILDGWDAPWSRITYEEIPFHEIYRHVKDLQPNCLLSDLNAGKYPDAGLYYTDVKAFEQNAGQELPAESRLPAYSCVTLTDGWFWKNGDDRKPLKSAKQVVEEWLIPQNERHCNLILNAPPTPDGQLADNVLERLAEIGQMWMHPGAAAKVSPSQVITKPNLATGRPIRATSAADTIGPDQANDGDFESYWTPDTGAHGGAIEVFLSPGTKFNRIVVVSDGKTGCYSAMGESDAWIKLVDTANPAAVQINDVPVATADRIRFSFSGTPRIYEIGIYLEP